MMRMSNEGDVDDEDEDDDDDDDDELDLQHGPKCSPCGKRGVLQPQ